MNEAKTHMHEPRMASLPGNVGSMDATHVAHERTTKDISSLMLHVHSTLRAIIQEKYCIQLMVTQLAGMTKHLYCSNEYAIGIHDRTLLDNVIFTLEELAPNGNIQSVCYHGAWLVTDNSYLAWSTRWFRHRHCW